MYACKYSTKFSECLQLQSGLSRGSAPGPGVGCAPKPCISSHSCACYTCVSLKKILTGCALSCLFLCDCGLLLSDAFTDGVCFILGLHLGVLQPGGGNFLLVFFH